MKIRTGDNVVVIAGKDKGKTGTVIRVLPTKNRVVVEGINMRVRHMRKTTQGPGQRIKYEAGLSVSNVMIVDPKTKKPTRVGYKVDEKGHKKRVAKASGEVIATVAKATTVKTPKTTKAKAPKKADKASSESSESSVASAPSGMPPKKQPFWKRAFNNDTPDSDTGATRANDNAPAAAPTVHRTSRESNG